MACGVDTSLKKPIMNDMNESAKSCELKIAYVRASQTLQCCDPPHPLRWVTKLLAVLEVSLSLATHSTGLRSLRVTPRRLCNTLLKAKLVAGSTGSSK